MHTPMHMYHFTQIYTCIYRDMPTVIYIYIYIYVCLSHSANTLVKDMNPTILAPAMGK